MLSHEMLSDSMSDNPMSFEYMLAGNMQWWAYSYELRFCNGVTNVQLFFNVKTITSYKCVEIKLVKHYHRYKNKL
jgi:hypothetical protein